MKKEDVDLYLKNIKNAKTQDEKLAYSKEFLVLINNSICFIDHKRTMHSYKNVTAIKDYIVSTGALSLLNEIGAAHIIDLARITGAIIDKSTAKNKDQEQRKIDSHIEKLLSDPNMLPENLTQEQLDLYDGLLTRAVYTAIDRGKPVKEEVASSVQRFFDRLPEDKSFKSTILYQKQLFRVMQERDDIKDLIPRLSKEEYENKIAGFTKNIHGEIVRFREYDNVVNEYLSFYGDSVSLEKKQEFLSNIMNYQFSGEIHLSKTYTEYFSKSKRDDDKAILKRYDKRIIKECFARLFEMDESDISFTDYERELLDVYLEKKEIENPSYNPLDTRSYIPRTIEAPHLLVKDLEFLFDSGDEDTIEITKYIGRIKNKYSNTKPNNPVAKKLYDAIYKLEVFDVLKKNLKTIALKEKGSLVNDRGLTVEDCADIALELMLEANYSKGASVLGGVVYSQKRDKNRRKDLEFDLDDIMLGPDEYRYLSSLLNSKGKSIYDSRAMRKLAELYVDRLDNFKDVGTYDKEKIIGYISTVAAKPEFNLFNEQGISDLLQIMAVKKFGIPSYDIKKALKDAINQNPSYAISLEDATIEANRFVAEFSERPIDISREADFDKFLVHLSKIKLESEKTNYVLPREYVDFLMKQIIDPNSLVNIKRDKYTSVAERVVEDFGKLDNIDINGPQRFNYTYKTRDYLVVDRTSGTHVDNIVVAKRNRIKRLFNGDLSPINTIYHENTHMTQEDRLEKLPTNYKEYMMQKERVIREVSPKYYNENYTMMYIEIEARERAAQKTAKYIGKNLLPSSVIKVAEAIRDNVVDFLSERHRKMQKKYEKDSKKESDLYKPAMNKKGKDGKIRTINKVFDTDVNTVKVAENLQLVPGLKYEYDIDGRKRGLSDQIDFALNPSFRINLNLMREIIRENYKEIPNNTLGSLQAIIQYSKGNTNQKQNEFLEGILEDHLISGIDSYKERLTKVKDLNNRIDLTAYYNINEIMRLYEEGAKLPSILTTPNEQGNTPLDMLKEIAENLQERKPDIKADSEALHRFEYNDDGTKKTLTGQLTMLNQQKVGLYPNVVAESLDANRSVKDEGLVYLPQCFDENFPDDKKKFYDDFLQRNLANHMIRYKNSLKNRSGKCNLEDIESYKILRVLKNITDKKDCMFTTLSNPSDRMIRCIKEALDATTEKWPNIYKKFEFRQIFYKQNFTNIKDVINFTKDNAQYVDYDVMSDLIKESGLVNKDNDLELLWSCVRRGMIHNTNPSKEELNFTNRLLQENAPTFINNYMDVLRNNKDLNYLAVCRNYELINLFINIAKKDPGSPSIQGLSVKDKDGKSGIDRLIDLKNMMIEKYPRIETEATIISQYMRDKDNKLLSFDEQMTMALNPNNNIDLDTMRTAIRESGSVKREGSLELLNNILKYRMFANIGEKNFDGTYSSDIRKHFFIEDVYKDNIHAYVDSYQARLSNAEEMDKKQLLSDYYSVSFFVMEYEEPYMMMEGFRLGFHSYDENGKTPLDKLRGIRDTLEKMPGIESEYNRYKYKEDGNKRSLSEMIDYARENSGNVSLPFMQTVIRESDVAKDDNSLSMLESLNKFIHVVSEDSEVDFVNGVIKNCLPTCIDNYAQTFEDEKHQRTDNDLIAYQNIVRYLNSSKANRKLGQSEGAVQVSPESQEQDSTAESKKTVTKRLEEIKSMMEERWPGIDRDAQNLDKKRNRRGIFGQSTLYDQLLKNKVSVVGKREAANMEGRMAEKKVEIEYDG